MIKASFYNNAAIATIVLAMVSNKHATAATCSCASVPLVNSTQSPALYEGQFNLSLVYSHHSINDLVAGSKTIEDETNRSRSSDSWVLGLSYGVSDNITLAMVANTTRQQRQISAFGNQSQETSGVGDGLISISYTPAPLTVYNQHEYGVGLGYKLAWGDNDQRQASGIRFAEDMQPSSGATGQVAWVYYAMNLNQAGTSQLWFSLDASRNDENDFEYQRGNDVNARVAWQTSVWDKVSLRASLSYRDAKPNRRAGVLIPNTGGEWLNFTPSLQYQFASNWQLGVSYTMPLARDLNGALQFSTDSAWSISISTSF